MPCWILWFNHYGSLMSHQVTLAFITQIRMGNVICPKAHYDSSSKSSHLLNIYCVYNMQILCPIKNIEVTPMNLHWGRGIKKQQGQYHPHFTGEEAIKGINNFHGPAQFTW